ncbi:MAG: hypothetical protein Q8Q29_05500 [Actinomycetota bacterium]|nr:hypothetical protein [Actinomycetota bacterium]
MASWAGRSLPIAMVLVALALSLCLFQVASTGTHHAGMSPDVCSGFFLVSFFVILPYFTNVGALPAEPLSLFRPVTLHLLDPPPKFATVS